MSLTSVRDSSRKQGNWREFARLLRAKILSIGLGEVDAEQSLDSLEACRQLSIILPVNDSPDVVEHCFSSLEKYAKRTEILVVDDGSREPDTLRVIQDFSGRNNWTVIRHAEPKGHTLCCWEASIAASRPVICLLNSDTIVTPWSWAGPVSALNVENVAVSGPSTSWSATVQMQTRAMHCRHYWSESQILGYAHKITRRKSELIDIPEASGFALFIRREMWMSFGGFDQNLPDYGNESEFSIRVRKSGRRIVWVPNSYVHHLGRQSYGRRDISELNARWAAARDYIVRKHCDLARGSEC